MWQVQVQLALHSFFLIVVHVYLIFIAELLCGIGFVYFLKIMHSITLKVKRSRLPRKIRRMESEQLVSHPIFLPNLKRQASHYLESVEPKHVRLRPMTTSNAAAADDDNDDDNDDDDDDLIYVDVDPDPIMGPLFEVNRVLK